ncbi:MAG: ferrochelatase, partial [Alphaproteobacteria bacterium]|nr:ferrochelatase [Alphaproteobacteria bacterium]
SSRVLFSAHGLPEKVIKKGDPYQWQVEQSVAKIVKKLALPELDYVVCYQSRVGPLKWIGPSTEEEIKRAGAEKKSLIIVPIAFVSEHSETLVELDIEYKHLAHEHVVPEYIRIPALATQEHFIDALASLCVNAPRDTSVSSNTGKRICPKEFCQCLAG